MLADIEVIETESVCKDCFLDDVAKH